MLLLLTGRLDDSCYNLILNLSEKQETTFAVLRTKGEAAFMKERLNKSANCFEMSFLEEIIFYKVYYLDQKPY